MVISRHQMSHIVVMETLINSNGINQGEILDNNKPELNRNWSWRNIQQLLVLIGNAHLEAGLFRSPSCNEVCAAAFYHPLLLMLIAIVVSLTFKIVFLLRCWETHKKFFIWNSLISSAKRTHMDNGQHSNYNILEMYLVLKDDPSEFEMLRILIASINQGTILSSNRCMI